MARIEWVSLRLENWALWRLRRDGHGLGYSGTSSLLRLAASGRREATIPVDEVDASVTDQAVQSLQTTHPHLHTTLMAYYIEGLTVRGVALRIGRADSTVKAQFDQADRALAAWFVARTAERRARAARGRTTGSSTP